MALQTKAGDPARLEAQQAWLGSRSQRCELADWLGDRKMRSLRAPPGSMGYDWARVRVVHAMGSGDGLTVLIAPHTGPYWVRGYLYPARNDDFVVRVSNPWNTAGTIAVARVRSVRSAIRLLVFGERDRDVVEVADLADLEAQRRQDDRG